MPFTTIKTEELIHEKKQKDKVFAKQWMRAGTNIS